MASKQGFKNLAINYGRGDKSVTNAPLGGGDSTKRLQTKGNAKAEGSDGLSMGGHIRQSGHAKSSSTGSNKPGYHKAAK